MNTIKTSSPRWSEKITAYFLQNYRLTALSLIFLVAVGIGSTALMRTTGFPSPDINLIVVQTTYLGASSESVADTVTEPIEGVIKNIEGVDTFSSQSRNSISLITVNIKDGIDPNDVRSEIDTGISALDLPEEVDAPVVSVPSIGGPDILLSVVNADPALVYAVSKEIESRIGDLPETSSVKPLVALEPVLQVTLDTKKLEDESLTIQAVQEALQTIGEAIPAASNVVVNDANRSILTLASEVSVSDVKNMPIRAEQKTITQTPVGPITTTVSALTLADVADVTQNYRFENNNQPLIGYTEEGGAVVSSAITLMIDAAQGTQLSDYSVAVDEQLAEIQNTTLVRLDQDVPETNGTVLLEHFTANESNDEQVKEVVSGLIGGTLDIEGPLKHAGWLLGGIQLVFLVMLAFVSWRAAIISAFAIPLSLVFSNIYLYAIGEDLNTLVLFSLVLVIGLVVDPALVILESIQRKIDAGETGNKAALAAVRDIGTGLFLATLTNIIVFAPFGLISGFLGEIFKYIPMTIIPAVIGSYVVPLIFLAWFGGHFLKRKKGATADEQENLFILGRWLIALNNWILASHVIVRTVIIVIALSIPVGVAGYFFSSGQISVVQFSTSDDSDFLTLGYSHFPDATQKQKAEREQELYNTIQKEEDVLSIFPLGSEGGYYMRLDGKKDRVDGRSATDIRNAVREHIKEAGIAKNFYDLQVSVESIGGPQAAYEIALAVASKDATMRRDAALAVGTVLQDMCFVDGAASINPDCAPENTIVTAVDDGYTNKEQQSVEVVLNRQKIQEKQLAVSGAPLGLLVNGAIRNAYAVNDNKKVGTLEDDGTSVQIILDTNADNPDNLDAIRDIVVLKTPVETVRVKDIADVREVSSEAAIRRSNGKTVALIQARLQEGKNDQQTAALVTAAALEYFQKDDGAALKQFDLEASDIEQYSEGSTASANKSFQDLFIALLLAIVLSYIVLAVFFNSFTQPLTILFTIPLTFVGLFPGLAWFANGQFGFLEIIGMIILVGLVENVAIFLIDAARQKIEEDGWDEKRAIAYAAGIRLRPVLMTKFTAVASLLPLAILSETYRSLAVVIMTGLITSGFTSLITTPILYIFFRFVSRHFWNFGFLGKILMILFFPVAVLYCGWRDKRTA